MTTMWEFPALAEACEIKPSKAEARRRLSDSDVVSFVPMEDLGIDQKYVCHRQTRVLSEVIGSYTYFADGDVILAKITPCFENGKLGIAKSLEGGAGFGSSEYIVFRPSPRLDAQWLYYFLSRDSFRAEGEVHMGGAVGHKRVAKDFIENCAIPLPALKEQQRIVGILDEAFAGIATAKTNAARSLKNIGALFESQLQSLLDAPRAEWERTTLDEATGGVFTGPFGSLLHKRDYVEGGIPLVNPAHITDSGIEPDQRKTVTQETAERLASYCLRKGDVVIGRRGEMGRCAVVTEVEDGWLCGTGSFVIRSSSRCDPRFVVRLLRSERCRRELEEIAGGAVMPNLSNTDLGRFCIDLPPIETQTAIVEQCETLDLQRRQLECIYERKLAALDELKQSLLHQAFSGQL